VNYNIGEIMEKICLICTLGNRDIQFKKEYKDIIEEKLDIKLIFNRDDNSYYVVDPNEFKPTTKKIFDNYDDLKKYIDMPMINKILEKYHNISKIYIIATDQNCADENYKIKDTIYEAEIIKKIILDRYGINSEIIPAEFNAKDMKRWFELIKGLFDAILKDDNKIVIEFSGGMSETRESIRLASLFNENITVYEIIKNELRDMNSYFYEQSIAKEKIKELIDKHNYTGALSFDKYLKDHPKKNEIIGALKYSNYRLNFDFDNANGIARKNSIIGGLNERLEKINDEKSNTIEKLEYLILELLDNMEIELKNGNYANFLARVYRLEEAMGQYIILSFFDDDEIGIIIEYKYQKPRQQSYGYFREHPKKLMSKDYYKKLGLSKILASYFKDLNNKSNKNKAEFYLLDEILENKIHIRNPLDTNNYEYIIPLICNYSFENTKKREKYNKLEKIFKNIVHTYKYNNENLRNSTIVAHGFEGINEYKINNVLSKREIHKPISEFFKDDIRGKFYNIVNKNNKNENKNIFDEIKEAIISNL
jgi:hypothetical protein